MPGFNGTGPMGQGSQTGRGMGSCGCGMGIGRRSGGFRTWFQKPTVDDLKSQKEYLENELKALDQDIIDSSK